jgi:hypothetical protein
MRRASIAAASVALLALCSNKRAAAQACCSTTGSEEFGVVNRCSTALVAAQISASHALGSYDARGRYLAIDGAVDDGVLALGAGARLWPSSLQIHGSVPFRLQRRELSGLSPSTAGGIGDASLALRWTALSDPIGAVSSEPSSWVPFLDLYAGARLPTGRPPEDSEEPSGADVTGDGAFAPFAGAKISKFFGMHHVLLLQALYTARLARDVAAGPGGGQSSFDAGDVVTLRTGWLYLHDIYLSGGPFVELELAGAAEQDGRRVADSEARRLRFGGHVSWLFDYPSWEGIVSVSSDAFWDGTSKNVPFAGPAVGLTISRHFP